MDDMARHLAYDVSLWLRRITPCMRSGAIIPIERT